MNFEIYFDESNKLDKKSGINSYYGVIGLDYSIRNDFDTFMINNEIFTELHFNEFSLDKVDKYLKAVEYALNKVDANFYIVNKAEAFKLCAQIDINETELRKLFYIKIPERLIYGMTRKMKEFTRVDIYIDKSDEYGEVTEEILCNEAFLEKLKYICIKGGENQNDLIKAHMYEKMNHIQLPKTLKSQLNAQALYRGLHYSVNTVKQIDSKTSKSIQIIDVLLGIVRFLMEEEYLNPNEVISAANMGKILKNTMFNKDEIILIKSCYEYKKLKKTGEENYNLILLGDEEKTKALRKINKKVKIYSQKSIQKSEFIYRLLIKPINLNRFYNFNIFVWSEEDNMSLTDNTVQGLHKSVVKDHFSKYVAQFFQFKTDYDTLNRISLQKFYINNYIHNKKSVLLNESDYKDFLNFGNSLKLLVRRYLKELKIDTLTT